MTRWTVRLSSAAIKDLDRLPPRVAPAVVEFLFGPLADNPHRVGKPLRGELSGLCSARRGDYRVLYETDGSADAVIVHRIRHRANAYRPPGA